MSEKIQERLSLLNYLVNVMHEVSTGFSYKCIFGKVCVCVRERERERMGGGQAETECTLGLKGKERLEKILNFKNFF